MNESLNVLIVDADVSIQNIVEEILSDGGFEPKAASSVEEAIALLNAHKFRAIIIDISFGNDHVKGWALGRRARAFNPALPVLIASRTIAFSKFAISSSIVEESTTTSSVGKPIASQFLGGARPNWTLIALACLPASAIAISLRYPFG